MANSTTDQECAPRPPRSQKSKDEIFWAIFEAVIRLDVTKGHLAWKISDVARTSKISRPLIYYYFGNSKENILEAAIDYMGEEYFGLGEERLQLWRSGRVLDSVLQTRFLCQKAPYIHFFYMLRRHMESFVGEKLRSLEQRYRQKLHDFLPENNKDDIEALAAVLVGLVTIPELSEAGVANALSVIQRNLTFKKELN